MQEEEARRRAEIDRQRASEQEPTAPVVTAPLDGEGGDVVDDRRREHDRQEAPVPPGVEEPGREHEEREAGRLVPQPQQPTSRVVGPPPVSVTQRPAADEDRGQEPEEEGVAVEQHGSAQRAVGVRGDVRE